MNNYAAILILLFITTPVNAQTSNDEKPGTKIDIKKDGSMTINTKGAEGQDDSKIKVGGTGLNIEVTPAEQKKRYEAWQQRGGVMAGVTYSGGLSMMSGDGFSGVGFGFDFGVDGYSVSPPDPTKNISNWSALKYGMGYGMSFDSISYDSVQIDDQSWLTQTITFKLGYTMGSGTFKMWDKWTGFIMHLNWVPTYQMITPDEGDVSEDFNASGFSIDFDAGDLQTAFGKVAPKPHFRFSLFFLPPVGDLEVTILRLNFGMATY